MLLLDEKKIMADSLEHGTMKFVEFVKFNNIDLDSIFVDKFFHNIQNNMPIYMNKDMIGYFGYSGLMKAQRKRLCELIETNFIDYQDKLWWDFKNKDYIEYRKSLLGQANHKKIDESVDLELLYPPAPTGQGKSNTKHLLVSPKLFKEMLMVCQTEKGKQVRRYYVDMMEVMELYIKFQNQVQIKSLNVQLSDIKSILVNAEVERKKAEIERKKTEERAEIERKKAEIERKKAEARFQKLLGYAEDTNETLNEVALERVEVSKLNVNKRPKFIILRDPNDDELPYYVIRRQNESMQDGINEIKAEYPDLEQWLSINQPNAIAFFNLIKKELGQYMVRDKNWFGLTDITPVEFKKKIKELNKRLVKPKRKTKASN